MSGQLIYDVVMRVEKDGRVWYDCPICGRLEGKAAHEHGPAHIVEDASQ